MNRFNLKPDQPGDIPPELLFDCLIIGSGPSGLSLGVLLARVGKTCLILEQHPDKLGGGMHSFQRRKNGLTWEFDTGVHYMGELGEGEDWRVLLDKLTGGEVEFNRLDTTPGNNNLVIDEVVQYDQRRGHTGEVRKTPRCSPLGAYVGIGGEEEEEAYIRDLGNNEGLMIPWLVWRALKSKWKPWGWLLKGWLAYPYLKRALLTAEEGLIKLGIKGEGLDYLPWGCTGVPREEISWSTYQGLHQHYGGGAYYPREGSQKLAQGFLGEIRRLQPRSKMLVGTVVNKLLVVDGQCLGVQAYRKGRLRNYYGRQVVSTMALHKTFRLLNVPLSLDFQVNKLSKVERTPGHFFLFLGLDNKDHLEFPSSNTWIMNEPFLQDLLGVEYLAIGFPRAKQGFPRDRAQGCTIILGNVTWEKFQSENNHWCDELVETAVMKVFEREFPRFAPLVILREVGSPYTTNKYLGVDNGQSYGLKSTPALARAQATWLNPSLEEVEPSIPRGFLISGQCLTQDGIPAAVLSALLTSCMLMPLWTWAWMIWGLLKKSAGGGEKKNKSI